MDFKGHDPCFYLSIRFKNQSSSFYMRYFLIAWLFETFYSIHVIYIMVYSFYNLKKAKTIKIKVIVLLADN